MKQNADKLGLRMKFLEEAGRADSRVPPTKSEYTASIRLLLFGFLMGLNAGLQEFERGLATPVPVTLNLFPRCLL